MSKSTISTLRDLAPAGVVYNNKETLSGVYDDEHLMASDVAKYVGFPVAMFEISECGNVSYFIVPLSEKQRLLNSRKPLGERVVTLITTAIA